jgi:hypothetical protein
MPESVDPAWAKEVLEWWIEHGDAALTNNRGVREFTFCDNGPATDAMLERELQTRRVIGVVLGMQNVDSLVRPVGGRRRSPGAAPIAPIVDD